MVCLGPVLRKPFVNINVYAPKEMVGTRHFYTLELRGLSFVIATKGVMGAVSETNTWLLRFLYNLE